MLSEFARKWFNKLYEFLTASAVEEIIPPNGNLLDLNGKATFPMEREQLSHARCPDCGGKLFHPGPEGGMSINIKCAETSCGSKFNWCPPFLPQRISNDDMFYQNPARTLVQMVFG